MKKIQNKYLILETNKKIGMKQKIKNIISNFMALNYKFKMSFIKIASTNKKYNVTVCAIFKNESKYLKEWIEFNHIVGVEHFYLYNNNSEDDYMKVLKPYIDSNLVTLIQWEKNQAQMECYCDCISKFSSESQWIGFIDIDEFIVPKSTNSIYEFLKPFEKNRGSVKIYWKMFGTSGLIERKEKELVTETFTVCWPKYYSVGKCFYNTNFNFNGNDHRNNCLHHILWTEYKGKCYPPVNVFNKISIENVDKVYGVEHPIQINHYFTKSYKEYIEKCAKGDVYFKINPHDEEYFYLHEHENISIDYSAYKYLIELKMSMERNNDGKI